MFQSLRGASLTGMPAMIAGKNAGSNTYSVGPRVGSAVLVVASGEGGGTAMVSKIATGVVTRHRLSLGEIGHAECIHSPNLVLFVV